jgi:hypothetical protein
LTPEAKRRSATPRFARPFFSMVTLSRNVPSAPDARNPELERGGSDFNVAHSLAGNFLWQPRFTRNPLLLDTSPSASSSDHEHAPHA